MKRSAWITATISSLCCHCMIEAYEVTTATDADLRSGIMAVNAAGGTLTFAPGLAGSIITITSALPQLTNQTNPISINTATGPFITVDGAGAHPLFYAGPQTRVTITNLNLRNAASIGGPGGPGFIDDGLFSVGGGGGGGLGAGGALFVDQQAIVSLSNVSFYSNTAVGGRGGSGSFPPLGAPVDSTFGSAAYGGGGGGGAFYGDFASGGEGGGTQLLVNTIGQGGGGGGGSGPGSAGQLVSGGNGGGAGAGAGGGQGVPGGAGEALFSGGGGGGGNGNSADSCPLQALGGQGGAGGDFGGGGGGAGGNGGVVPMLPDPAYVSGGIGGFGGGGGGGGQELYIVGLCPAFSNIPSDIATFGGQGGFGGGGGGMGSTSVFAGGNGGSILFPSLFGGGGGGAGLGGAIFVRDTGVLQIHYSLPGVTGITGNSAVGGSGGGGLVGSVPLTASPGAAYGQDLFLNAGGALTFVVDAPLTIASAIDSDPDIFNSDIAVTVQGSSILTLLGNNTFSGGITVNQGGQLQIATEKNLGLTAPSSGVLTLDQGTLHSRGATLTVERGVQLGMGGGTVSAPFGGIAQFLGDIIDVTNNGILTVAGSGAVQLSGQNTYSGQTIIGPSATLQILSTGSLPDVPILIAEGVLDLVSFVGPFSSPISGSGTINIQSGSFLDLAGANSSTGAIVVAPGATLGIATSASLSSDMRLQDDGVIEFHYPSGVISATAITGQGSVLMDGAGTLLLSIDNTYSNGTFLNQGIVQIRGGSALGSGIATFNGGALELLSDFSGPLGMTALVESGGGIVRVDAPLLATATGDWTLNGLVKIDGGGQLSLTGSWHGAGLMTIGEDTTVIISHNTVLPSSVAIGGSGGVTISAPDVLFQGSKSYGGTTTIVPGSTLTIGTPSSFPNHSSMVDDGSLVFNFSSPSLLIEVAGSITGAGSLTVQQGIVTLSGSNTYDGVTTIFPDGKLQIAAVAAIPAHGTVIDNGHLIFQNTSGTALPGPISGMGLVRMDGTGGRVSLTGSNSYQAGTFLNSGRVQIEQESALGNGALTFNGGLLELRPLFTGSIGSTAVLNSNGGTIQLDNVDLGYGGIIEGVGALTLKGSGVVTPSALNTYTGNTVVEPGITLELLQVANLPMSSLVMNNGNVVFNTISANAFIPNTIQGLGMVTLTGPSSFVLQHSPNTYNGGTILSLGRLAITSFSQVGSGPITLLGGGTLELAGGSYSTSRSFVLGVGGGRIVLDSGASFALSGPISSSIGSPLAIEGPGMMIFSGTSSTSGLVTIGNGSATQTRLSLDGASLAGPVTISIGSIMTGYGSMGELINYGTIAMGSSDALVVTGDYTQSGAATLQMSITGSSGNSVIHASGVTNLGGTLVVNAKPGVYLFGTTYTLLSSQDPLLTTFSQVELPAFPQLELLYSQDPHVYLIVTSQSVLDGVPVQGHNPQQVFGNLQAITHTASSDLVRVIEAMSDLDSAPLSAALDQLHPAPFGAFDLLNANASSFLTSIFARHSAETCCLNLNQPCGYSNASLWVQPFGSFYDQDRVGEQVGFHAQTLGVAAGVNFSQMSGLLVGMGAAFSSSELTWHHGRGNGVMDKATLALYADYTRENFSCETSILGSLDIFTASRHISFSTINRYAKHQKGGQDLTAHVGGGGDFGIGAYSLRPFANLDYFYMYQKPFAEHGADSLNLEVTGNRSNMLRSELGLSATRSFVMGHGGCFAPMIFLSGINECYLVKRHYESNFINKSPSFRVRTWSHPIYLISPGAELSFLWHTGLSAAVRYSAELNVRTCVQKLDARLEWFF